MYVQISVQEENKIQEALSLLIREGECVTFYFAPNWIEVRDCNKRLLIQIIGGELQRNATMLTEEHVRNLIRWKRLGILSTLSQFEEQLESAIEQQHCFLTMPTEIHPNKNDLTFVIDDTIFDQVHF